MKFLRLAIASCTTAVYSLHKVRACFLYLARPPPLWTRLSCSAKQSGCRQSSTREYVAKYAAKCGASTELLSEIQYEIPAMYAFHTKQRSAGQSRPPPTGPISELCLCLL